MSLEVDDLCETIDRIELGRDKIFTNKTETKGSPDRDHVSRPNSNICYSFSIFARKYQVYVQYFKFKM